MLFGDTVLVGMCMSPWRHYCALHAEYVHWCYGKCKRNCQCTCFFVPMSHRQKYPPCGGANHGNTCYGQRRVKCECFPSVLPLAPPVGGPTTARGATANAEASASAFPPTLFLGALSPPKRGECCHTKAPPTFGGAQLRGGWPPLWGGQLPFPLATGPPIVWGGHGAWCYGERRGKCECFPSHPFFGASSPQNGGSVATQRPPPPLGGGQLRGGWPPPVGGPTSLPSCHWPPHSGGGPRRLVLRQAPRQMRVLSLPFFWCLIPPKTGGSVATQRPPPPLGGAQLRGGWPPPVGGQLPFPLATGPP